MTYKSEIIRAMAYLGERKNTLFIGQSVCYSGHVMFNTLEDAKVPMSKRIELPVFEDTQMGMSIGLSLAGFLPISLYPRIDFLLCACNQLVNHLDKIYEMSRGEFSPKVIIRTMVGSKEPLNPGPQHCQDHTEALRYMLTNVKVVKLCTPESVFPNYAEALNRDYSTILVEMGDLYEN